MAGFLVRYHMVRAYRKELRINILKTTTAAAILLTESSAGYASGPYTLDSGRLTFELTDGDDNLVLSQDSNDIEYTLDGQSGSISGVESVTVWSKGGDDTISIWV